MPTYRAAPHERTYSIGQLVNEVGVPKRRIQDWRRLGLIDPPQPPVGCAARYTDRHVAQCRALLRLKERTPRFEEIGALLAEDGIDAVTFLRRIERHPHA